MRPKATYVHLSEKDRNTLEELASKNNMSVSAFIRAALQPHLNSDDGVLNSSKLEHDLGALEQPFDALYSVSPVTGRRKNQVTVYFTDEEYAYVKAAAKGHTASTYIRNHLLRSGNSRFNFIVKTDDIDTLTKQNEELNLHFVGFVQSLAIRSTITNADFVRCRELLEEINANTLALKNAVLKNRYSIRQQGRRYLEKQIRALLGKPPSTKESDTVKEPAEDDDDE